MEKDAETNHVLSVRCQFCVYFGKEETPGMKRQRQQTKNVITWSIPFRPEKFVSHHKGQHPLKWAEYQQFDIETEKKFFEGVSPFMNTISAFLAPVRKTVTFKVRKEIVDRII